MSSLAQQPLVFVLPDGHGGVSGGNIYNAELIAALGRRGAPVEARSIGELASGQLAQLAGVTLFDTLDLAQIVAATAQGPVGPRGLIVHHLPSLEPGLPGDHPSLELEARALPWFDFYLSTSAFTTRLLGARGLDPRRLLTVRPGVASCQRSRTRSAAPPLRALLVGNLIARKAVLELLDGLRAAGDEAFELSIVGRSDLDPAYARACAQRVASTPGLSSRVRFLGVQPYERMSELYDAAHVLVSAARMETYGMALAEAKAHGLPILASEGGNVRDHFRDGHDGLLFASIPELAQGLLELASAPARLERLLAAAALAASTAPYSWDDAAESLLEQLQALVRGAGLTRRPTTRSPA
ncbi:MAG: glycosyltransferase family 4 protein [Polyangiaceae bacterium]